jgi:septum formation protein
MRAGESTCYIWQVRELILASASPRRHELLATAGFHFSVRSRPVEEVRRAGERPLEYVRRLSYDKAVAARMAADEIVLGADTVVIVDNEVLEKPRDVADAGRMLRLLSGRAHQVITGICLLYQHSVVQDHAITDVHFAELTNGEIAEYVASGEPMDKAGGYGIQGLASKFVDRVDGCYFNVMGLPLSLMYRHYCKLFACE